MSNRKQSDTMGPSGIIYSLCVLYKSSFYIFIIKQDIRIYIYYIYVAYSRPNDWSDWAEFFCEHSWVAGGC